MKRPFLLLAALALAGCRAAPTWWKGNLHTHSLWSDGNDFPEVIARWYREHGYHFLALSDHNTLSVGQRWMKVDDVVRRGGRTALQRYRELFGGEHVRTREVDGKLEVQLCPLARFRPLLEAPGQFLLVQAEEITDVCGKLPVHMNATNVRERIAPQHGATVAEILRNNLRAVLAQQDRLGVPMVVHLNHPNFQWAVTAEDLAAVAEERFFEVYNGHPEVHHEGDALHPSVEQLWDIANSLRLRRGEPPLFGLGVDDCHNYHNAAGSTPGRGWIMVQAPTLTAEALVQAIQDGRLYASSGVELRSVDFADGQLSLQIAAEPGVRYRTEFLGTRRGFDPTAAPPLDADGREVPGVTRRYHRSVGEVFAVATGASPSYRLRGCELYVRAVVTADRPPANPSFAGQHMQAWTQPVGWQARGAEGMPRP